MTKRTITINPVTRIEGHGTITVTLNDDGSVDTAHMNVTQFRGFEAFSRGRDFREMPVITPRICGICPVSHHLASAKACDAVAGTQPTPAANKLRELMHKAQIVQSHALSFFHLSSPDLLFGFDAPPAVRNIAGLVSDYPELAVRGVTMRKYGQEIIKTLGGKKVHPWHSIIGGVNRNLTTAERDMYLNGLDEQIQALLDTLPLIRKYLEDGGEEARDFATVETAYMGTVKADGALDLYEGDMRIRGANGHIVDQFKGSDYLKYIGEHVEEWSYLKFPFYRPTGFPAGSYRVGPLGRLNACDYIPTPLAQQELETFRSYAPSDTNGMVPYTLYYHYARLIETLFGLEKIGELLNDPDITSTDLRAPAGDITGEGIGVIEAPRGTLIHHYKTDEKGVLTDVNLIVATGHNNHAINLGIEKVARRYLDGNDVKEGVLNRMEHVIRCYDPCLSCSTHAVGKMPLDLRIQDKEGNLLERIVRD